MKLIDILNKFNRLLNIRDVLKKPKVDDTVPEDRFCVLESANNAYTYEGEKTGYDMTTQCKKCNQYVYKNDDLCLSYEYDKEINQNLKNFICTIDETAEGKLCPF